MCLCSFPGTIAVAVIDDTKWDMYATWLSDLTALPLLSDKDGKVICLKELAGHNIFKCFGMSGEVLWQVKPDGQTPPLTEDFHLGLDSMASAEEGVNVTKTAVIRGQSPDQKEQV